MEERRRRWRSRSRALRAIRPQAPYHPSTRQADSGYVSAWYLDEDYDGDCFVDCQMFFDFGKKPARTALGVDVEAHEFEFKVQSEPFPLRDHRRIAVKVVDVFGNESTVVKDLR